MNSEINKGSGKSFPQKGSMFHAVPVIDFTGSIQVRSLEIGSVEVNEQPIPAVRFLLDQNQSYPILAFGYQVGEIYAYCASALEMDMEDIDVKISCTLLTDIKGNLHVITSSFAWYTSNAFRENVAARIRHVFEKTAKGEFKICTVPFIVVKSGMPQ
jgi:hypothetical protein